MQRTTFTTIRAPLALGLACLIGGMPIALGACNKRTNVQKTETTRVKDTPEGTKVTTETTERKVETTPKP